VASSVAEQVEEQGRGAADHSRDVRELRRAGHEPDHLHDLSDPVQGAEGVAGLGEQDEGAGAGGQAALIGR
jgi:hypothetical protein